MDIKLELKEFDLSLSIESSLMEEIETSIKKHYPKEFGGVYIGQYSESGKCLKITSIILPKKFRNTKILFFRYPASINREIKKIFNETEGKSIYVGEWHSHPNGFPTPSSTDISTMFKIAKSKKVNIKYPLLSIYSYDGAKFDYNFFLICNTNVIKYEKS